LISWPILLSVKHIFVVWFKPPLNSKKKFQGIEKYTKISSGGYTTIGDVRNALNTRPKDMMESFLLGETFKYLYLLFADDAGRSEVNLKEWVVNTEAHLLPIREF